MPVDVLVGYKGDDDQYHGFLGSLEEEEYAMLQRLAERCQRRGILSIEGLKDLSDAKDLAARAQIKLYGFEKGLSEGERRRLGKVSEALGEALASFDVYRTRAPQLDFLLSFCVIDASYSELDGKGEYVSKNFEETGPPDTPLPSESGERGVVKHITVPEDFVNAIYEWIESDGRRWMSEASMVEDDEGALETEVEWWEENMRYFEEEAEDELTIMLFRALRNNVLKCRRTREQVLSASDWTTRIEVL